MAKKKEKRKPLAFTHADFLSLLGKTKNRIKRCQLIDMATSSQINSILECIQNILDRGLPLSKKDVNRLRKHKTIMRNVRHTKLNTNQRKELLKQKGGFLNALLPIATTFLSALFK